MASDHAVQRMGTWGAVVLAGAMVGALCDVRPAAAERLENQVAVFAALDKVTARISKLEVPLNQTVRFGSLEVTPRVCLNREPTEPPNTASFVEVEEVMLEGQKKRIFGGWMFAESPGLHAVEHPVFDVWLTECQKPVPRPEAAQAAAGTQPAGTDTTRRRVRR